MTTVFPLVFVLWNQGGNGGHLQLKLDHNDFERCWVNVGLALVLGCLVTKDPRIWKAFLGKSLHGWDFFYFILTEPKILKDRVWFPYYRLVC